MSSDVARRFIPYVYPTYDLLFSKYSQWMIEYPGETDLFLSAGFKDTDDVFPLYLGDDKTDEDAFRVCTFSDPST